MFSFFFYSKNPLLDAELVIPCGHTFCGFCVSHKTQGSKCEKCRDPVQAFCENQLANNFLSMVDGQCNWCKGTFPLHSAKDHLVICQEIEMHCKPCRIAVKRIYARWQTWCVDVESSLEGQTKKATRKQRAVWQRYLVHLTAGKTSKGGFNLYHA